MSQQQDNTGVPATSSPLDRLRDRRVLLGAGGLVVVVAAGGFFLLSGGSSDGSSAAAVPQHHVRAVTTTTAAPTAAATAAVVPAQFRDPFKPLYVAPVAAPAASSSAAPVVATTPSAPTIVVVEPTPSSAPSAAPSSAASDHTVSLVSASGSSASILYDGKPETVHTGQSFPSSTAGPFTLLSVAQGGRSTFAYKGSDADETFTISPGHSYLAGG